MTCAYCAETQGLQSCRSCGKSACSAHYVYNGGHILCTRCYSQAYQAPHEAAFTPATPAAYAAPAAPATPAASRLTTRTANGKSADKARRRIIWSWIFTGVVGGWIAISLMVKAFTPDYVTGNAPTGLLLLVPVAIYGAWALFWGWIPIWHGWQRFLRGIGCLIAPTLVFAAIFLIMGALALVYGALGGAFVQYLATRRVAQGLP